MRDAFHASYQAAGREGLPWTITGSQKFNTRQVDERMAVVEFIGEMDLYTTIRAQRLTAQLIQQGCHCLIIDLHQTDYLDSTAWDAHRDAAPCTRARRRLTTGRSALSCAPFCWKLPASR